MLSAAHTAYLKSLMVTVATSVFSLPAKIADHLSQTTPQLSLSHILENCNIAKKKYALSHFQYAEGMVLSAASKPTSVFPLIFFTDFLILKIE